MAAHVLLNGQTKWRATGAFTDSNQSHVRAPVAFAAEPDACRLFCCFPYLPAISVEPPCCRLRYPIQELTYILSL